MGRARGLKRSQLCLQQGVLEGDDPGMETPGPGDTEARGDLEETPEVVGLEPDSKDLEDQSPPRSLPSSPNTGESPPGFPCHYPSRRCWSGNRQTSLPSAGPVQVLGVGSLEPALSCV